MDSTPIISSDIKNPRSPEQAFHMAGIEDMPIPPNSPNQMIQGQGRQDRDDFDDDSMDTDEEGGVRIITSSGEASSSDTLQLEKIYHQAPVTELDSSSYMWRLPVNPGHYNPQKLKHSQDHPIVKAYQRHCGIISKHWTCHPDDCIPLEVRKQTPYSLAMLSSLRRLASFTKQNFQLAQSLLLESWQERSSQRETLVNENVVLSETIVKRPRGMGRDSEFKIQENLFGLMLEDVDRVWRSIKRGRAQRRRANRASKPELKTPQCIARQQTKLALKLARNEDLQSSIAERVTKRRRNGRAAKLAAAQMTSFEDELVDVQIGSSIHGQTGFQGAFAAPPNSPVSTYDRPNIFASEVALREVGSRHNEQAGTANQDDEALYKPSKLDRHQDNQMSRVLNNIDIDTQKDMKRRRFRRLQAGGQSRSGHQKIAMPSEKTKFNSLPSLHAMAPATSATELARIGQLPLPDQTPFSLPVRTHKGDGLSSGEQTALSRSNVLLMKQPRI